MDFGRQPEELTCRLAYVDFDGELVLSKALTEFKDESLQEEFLDCGKMVTATTRIEQWIDGL